MKTRFIISALSLIGNLYAADFSDQNAFDRFYAQTISNTYRDINENVSFSETTSTTSSCWDVRTILQRSFLVKKRGISLSHAINDLIQPESRSSFECATAQNIAHWRVLTAFNIDAVIHKFEEADNSFFLPLMSVGIYNMFVNYIDNNQLYVRRILKTPYTIKNIPIDLNKELAIFEELGTMVEKLSHFFTCFSSSPQNGTLPYKTVEGGVMYLPNVDGVTGPGKGENLFCVNAEAGLYYGFGELFKTGPKTLLEVGKSLEIYANEKHPGLYIKSIMLHLKSLRSKGDIAQRIPEDIHPLQYLIPSESCVYFDLSKVREVILSFS